MTGMAVTGSMGPDNTAPFFWMVMFDSGGVLKGKVAIEDGRIDVSVESCTIESFMLPFIGRIADAIRAKGPRLTRGDVNDAIDEALA